MSAANSKWLIGPAGEICRKGWERRHVRARRVLYVDDHQLFRTGVRTHVFDCLLDPIRLVEFTNGTDAFEWLKRELENSRPVDLLLTDINHPGMNGFELIKAIRGYEKEIDRKPLPIVVLSMVGTEGGSYLGNLLPTINSWLDKGAGSNIITEAIENVLFGSEEDQKLRIHSFMFRISKCVLEKLAIPEGEFIEIKRGTGIHENIINIFWGGKRIGLCNSTNKSVFLEHLREANGKLKVALAWMRDDGDTFVIDFPVRFSVAADKA